MPVKRFEEPSALAKELNEVVARENPHVLAMLSGFMAYWLGLFEAAHHHDDEM